MSCAPASAGPSLPPLQRGRVFLMLDDRRPASNELFALRWAPSNRDTLSDHGNGLVGTNQAAWQTRKILWIGRSATRPQSTSTARAKPDGKRFARLAIDEAAKWFGTHFCVAESGRRSRSIHSLSRPCLTLELSHTTARGPRLSRDGFDLGQVKRDHNRCQLRPKLPATMLDSVAIEST